MLVYPAAVQDATCSSKGCLCRDRVPSYPSDLSDEQWAVLEPEARAVMAELVRAQGRPMVHDLRAMADGIGYVARYVLASFISGNQVVVVLLARRGESEQGTTDELACIPQRPEFPAAVSGRRVRFRAVRFGYRAAIVLPGLDLDIPAGQTVALVGETGAGKTTVARLIARFYDPGAGQVLLDGVDLRQLPDSVLRREIVLITQESFLFEGSVAENIRLGRPSATDLEVEEAARAIGAHAFIAALPEGYATKVGKRGGKSLA
jgi:ABC-type multidrug transport system fused ATPase/permease subunit